jgi:hypothetical protein
MVETSLRNTPMRRCASAGGTPLSLSFDSYALASPTGERAGVGFVPTQELLEDLSIREICACIGCGGRRREDHRKDGEHGTHKDSDSEIFY